MSPRMPNTGPVNTTRADTTSRARPSPAGAATHCSSWWKQRPHGTCAARQAFACGSHPGNSMHKTTRPCCRPTNKHHNTAVDAGPVLRAHPHACARMLEQANCAAPLSANHANHAISPCTDPVLQAHLELCMRRIACGSLPRHVACSAASHASTPSKSPTLCSRRTSGVRALTCTWKPAAPGLPPEKHPMLQAHLGRACNELSMDAGCAGIAP